MQYETEEQKLPASETAQPFEGRHFPGGLSWTSAVLAVLAIGSVMATLAGRLLVGLRWDGFLMAAAALAVAVVAALAFRLVLSRPIVEASMEQANDPLQDLLDSAGPAVVAIALDGRLTFANPAAERMLGYHASELMERWKIAEILASGEGARLVAEMERLCHLERPPASTPGERMATLLECLRALPPSQTPSFEAHLRHGDDTLFPVTVQISALRDNAGTVTGLMAVAVDQSGSLRQEQVPRESQERYRDLFENSNEMIATLSPAGQFLYANPAWQSCFGVESSVILALDSFEMLFEADERGEVAGLFRRALNGETIDRAPLRHHTADGRVLALEMSLSRRQKAGNPLAVRCLMRDATQQKQRENRLALQLLVSQILGENASPEVTAMRILEALCVSQSWDVAIKWLVNPELKHLEFCTAWGTPGRAVEGLIQESMGIAIRSGDELPGRCWQERRPIWIADLAASQPDSRVQSAVRKEMVSGWAVPVRVGSQILAVLEFYCHSALREDREALATVETVAASLGQVLARSQEHGRAEELYRQQEILLDSVADGICGVDRQGMVSFANPAAARLLGAEPARLTGKPVHELLHGAGDSSGRCGDDCPLLRSTGHQMAAAGEDTIFRGDGTSFPAEYILTPILDQGRFSGSVLSFRDISQRYTLDRLKDEFISTVSHELRTPLTSIRGALGLLSSGLLGEVNDKAANLLRIALNNSDRLVRLINDILDLERIQSGREPLAFRTVQLAELVGQAMDGMQPVAEAAGVQLIHDATQVQIAADPDRLLQVITNLLSNAIKFSPAGSTISVMLRPGATGVTLSVIDHGRGIPVDKLEVVFGRFQQVDASDSRQKGGSGLGLAICRTIVLQHAGRIWAERNPVRGSTFRVFLPYEPAAKGTIEAPDAAFDHEPGQGTILLADANPISRPHIAAQLTRHGYRVVEASTVEQTLEAAHQGVEAILLDTSLDGMNGWEILPMLRRLDPASKTPVVLLSVEDQPGPIDLLAKLPADTTGWVPKSVNEDALLGELARVLCGPGEKARILIVEDDVDLARVIGGVFARDNIDVQLAYSRQEALDACFTFQPQLVVLDIGLPDGDGFNLVDWLRQRQELARLPLVVYSGREFTAAERRQLTLGPTHFLTKVRVHPQQLEALVLTMLRSSRKMEEKALLE